jgi:hypothetical protein
MNQFMRSNYELQNPQASLGLDLNNRDALITRNDSTHDGLVSRHENREITVAKAPEYEVISRVDTGPSTTVVRIRLFSPEKKGTTVNPKQPLDLQPLTNDGKVDDQLVRPSLPKS